MRDLIISAVIVIILVTGWLIFSDYSHDEVHKMSSNIIEDIIPVIETESWDEAISLTNNLDRKWHQYKKTALFFLETGEINDIDSALARSMEYVKAKDVSNSAGELKSMSEQLLFLSSREKVNLSNIF